MSRIAATFDTLARTGRKALIPFITAGDPDPGMTVAIMHTLVSAGADVIELGVPFSDPMADGPTIQRASERALRHHTSLRDVIAMVAEFRRSNSTTPVVLMGYANPVEAMGCSAFAEAAKAGGVDGVLVVDCPPEEAGPLLAELEPRGIDAIFLLAPTTTEARMREIARVARGYIYYVSLKGVTGAATLDLAEVRARIPRIRAHIKLPIGVGFGIRDAATARAIAEFADAIVIGSRLVEEIECSPRPELLGRVAELLRGIRAGMDEGR
jgi:tryptophan synthase alpha chain